MLPHGSSMKVILEGRLGFVNAAVARGADLVPCISYGENAIFSKATLRIAQRFQSVSTIWFNFSPVVFYGRFGLMPHRKPLTLVTGPPIHVGIPIDRSADPARFAARCAELHCAYIEALQKLHAETRTAFGNETEQELEILSTASAAVLIRGGAL
eukprot:NODE_25268_length_593_cov_3.158798.p1 GENE.NODE_25268_length_593_cov_3.158798~~NODE_25268_length_593_cov_3.158798.p1  ORF type:complete len:179 (-),score=32.43 NODE_25268_length_593_cov_3.158798:55-519(-)